jgi:cytochrome c
MRTSNLIPVLFAGLLGLAACGESKETPAAPTASAPAAAPAVPAPTLADLPEPYSAASLENGKAVFAKCRNCHGLVATEGHKVGPNLHGVFERGTATAPKFKYSPALVAYAEDSWTPELVDHWLANPKTFVPGNGMFFNGIDKPDDRRDVIAYLLVETRK